MKLTRECYYYFVRNEIMVGPIVESISKGFGEGYEKGNIGLNLTLRTILKEN
jgi:hypothetical protein